MGKKLEEIKEKQPFTLINMNNINNKSLFNIFTNKYKEIYSYACDYIKNLKIVKIFYALKLNII